MQDELKNYNLDEMLIIDITKEWSKTYRTDGKPDWSHIFPYYAKNIFFKDPIQEIHGMDDFTKMTKRLTKRCKSLEMDIKHIIKEDHLIFMEWTMTMKFRIFPKTSMYGTSRLTLSDDGKIIEQRDYYDLWGDMYQRVPVYRGIYRWFMKTFFG
ncbi:MAG: nuclear transport factor 2 family protein [Acholeplasmataceae bacterium]